MVAPSVTQGKAIVLFCLVKKKTKTKNFRKISLVAKCKIHGENMDLKMRVTQCRVYPRSMLEFHPSTKKKTGLRDLHQEVHI